MAKNLPTYAKGRHKFDWFKFLNKKKITEDEWISARHAAMNWPSCACGNLCAAIPRFRDNAFYSVVEPMDRELCHSVGEPMDRELCQLGVYFAAQVYERRLDRARATFEAIEKRAAQILTDMGVIKHEKKNKRHTPARVRILPREDRAIKRSR